MKWLRLLALVPSGIAILLVRGYQRLISPWLGPHCRFHPTCSEYFVLAVKKHGLLFGAMKGVRRITKCHPWNPGGYDPP